MGFYDRHVLPHLLDCACGLALVTGQRRKIVPLARGRVLEVGIGSGLNLAHYDPQKVTTVVGLDPGAALLAMARRRAAAAAFPVEFVELAGESMLLDNASFDTIVVTYTLCSIPGVELALAQMRRVLKRDGELLFCEHGLAPDAGVARWQRRIDPLWGRIAGGCHLSRDIPALLRLNGFDVELAESDYLKGAPRFAGFHYVGTARPR
jgi:ubiquinone/menaquinone biosynthesis C-methylase UbiE